MNGVFFMADCVSMRYACYLFSVVLGIEQEIVSINVDERYVCFSRYCRQYRCRKNIY
jgi:hypothetical protein